MSTILLVIHIMVAFSMIVLILLQRSEGGALGMGGGGGGFVTGRGAANFLTRTTAVLAAIFFATSIALGIIGHRPAPAVSTGAPVREAPSQAPAGENAPAALPELKPLKVKPRPAPAETPAPAPAAPAPAAPAQPQVPQSQ